MNLEIPYERLSDKTKVEYIPLKLALNDVDTDTATVAIQGNDRAVVGGHQELRELTNGAYIAANTTNLLLIGLLSLVCVIILLYAIFYFVILRERRQTSLNYRQSPLNFVDNYYE
ncbi:ac78-like protein [Clanis bilineata nucleopolyhedrovirus]|uniref:Ac78-like protein n=1 Tax=Clanis bilineata nucleopolyhedrovirus TaxID=1307957 RepID=Q0N429_9ABAC|nr:ac78-like protein [Clanis bilineata nucleopolyhedrovirus]ABF47414.1 ac78-like protein [Clanis bilineata nucleopolyhedrovirus]